MSTIKYAAPRLRFMSLPEENLNRDIPLLKLVLSPGNVSSVLLAIKTQDSSKLPANFNTSCRIVTNAEDKKMNSLKMMHTNSVQIQKLVSAEASQLPALEQRNLRDSTDSLLIVNKLSDKVHRNNYFLMVEN
jgi:hypothetical protein